MRNGDQQKVVFVHPLGNENVRAAAKGLAIGNTLAAFYTAVAGYPGSLFGRIGKFGPFADVNRRTIDPKLAPYLHLKPARELLRLISNKLGVKSLFAAEKAPFSVDAVYGSFDKHIARKMRQFKEAGVSAIYAYEDGSLLSFKKAKENGIGCFYDLPIGYWGTMHRMLQEELNKRPDWASTIDGFNDSKEKLAKKDQELSLADHVFVASTFTALTLNDYPDKIESVSVIPYGFPEVTTNKVYRPVEQRKLDLLFVGALSQRKGIANLFDSLEGLDDKVNLTLVGRKIGAESSTLNNYLKKYNWIPSLSHPDILDLMKASDVLVFPSLFEGFGLVITEAMSQGTPVITTERTAGPDFIVNDVNGWIVEAGNTSALRNTILDLVENPGKIQRNGRAAMRSAAERPWSVYGEELCRAVNQLLKTQKKVVQF